MKVPSFFNNKIVRWVFLALAVMNIVGYLGTGAYECLLVFAVGYALTDNYCKNQSCSILGGLFAANFVWGCGRVKETFVETMKGAKEHSKDAADSATKAAQEAMKDPNAASDSKAQMLKAAQEAAAAYGKFSAAECAVGGGDKDKLKGVFKDGLTYTLEGDQCKIELA